MKSFNDRPVIVTLFENANYQMLMGDINADFIIYDCHGANKVNCKLPANHRIVNDLTPDIRPDILLSQNKMRHHKILADLAKRFNRPLFSLVHGIPEKSDLEYGHMIKSDVEIYYSDDHARLWEAEEYISIHICPLPNIKPDIGLYVNSENTFDSVFPVINAMAAGMCIVSPAVYEVNNIIFQGHSGFLYSRSKPNEKEILLRQIINNSDLIQEVGKNASERVFTLFSRQQFTDNWNALIHDYFERM